tara:strand:+ start:104 stop:340 length:237 start_codon:yes stop_codon:yes gene_type:complete
MRILINKEVKPTKIFSAFRSGELFIDYNESPNKVFMKTDDSTTINMANGRVDDSVHPDAKFTDVTDRFVLTNQGDSKQ